MVGGKGGQPKQNTQLTARLAVRANIESDNGLIKKAIVGDGVAGDVALDFVCYLLWGSEPNSFDAFPHREALQRMLDEKPVLQSDSAPTCA